MFLTAEQIERAKLETTFGSPRADRRHEHDDCIRIAFAWLDAQNTVKGKGRNIALKHVIEAWGCRYISESDVEVAAYLHPRIQGKYPRFNLSARLIEPHPDRLKDIGEANKHPGYRKERSSRIYAREEDAFGG